MATKQRWKCTVCGLKQAFSKQCKSCFNDNPSVSGNRKIIKPKTINTKHPWSAFHLFSNVITTPNDEIVCIIKQRQYIDEPEENIIPQIGIYDTKTNEWRTIQIPNSKFIAINNIKSTTCWIMQNHEVSSNILIIYGYIRGVYKYKYCLPDELCQIIIKYYISTDIKLDLWHKCSNIKFDKDMSQIICILITNHKKLTISQYSHLHKCADSELSPIIAMTTVDAEYHYIADDNHGKWNPNIPNLQEKLVKTFNFIKRFYVKDIIYSSKRNILLIIAAYGKGPANTIWSFDFDKKKWKRLYDLDLPYQIWRVECILTADQKYLVVIDVHSGWDQNNKLLILDLVNMKWIDVLIELEIKENNMNVAVMSNNDIHLLIEKSGNEKHYMFNFKDLLHS